MFWRAEIFFSENPPSKLQMVERGTIDDPRSMRSECDKTRILGFSNSTFFGFDVGDEVGGDVSAVEAHA
jgi:hypothetical protein